MKLVFDLGNQMQNMGKTQSCFSILCQSNAPLVFVRAAISVLSFAVWLVTLHAMLSGTVYCNRSCLWVCVFVGLLPR